MADLRPVRREFQCEDGQWYIRNTLPYRTSRNTIEGTVITFVDVTELKRSREEQWHRSAELEALMESVPAAVWIAGDPERRQVTANRLGYQTLRLAPGCNVSKSAPVEDRPSYRMFQAGRELAPEELPLQRAAAGQTVQDCEIDVLFEGGDVITIFGSAAPLKDPAGQIRGAVSAFIDITARKRVEQGMAESYILKTISADELRAAVRGKKAGREPMEFRAPCSGRGRAEQAVTRTSGLGTVPHPTNAPPAQGGPWGRFLQLFIFHLTRK